MFAGTNLSERTNRNSLTRLLKECSKQTGNGEKAAGKWWWRQEIEGAGAKGKRKQALRSKWKLSRIKQPDWNHSRIRQACSFGNKANASLPTYANVKVKATKQLATGTFGTFAGLIGYRKDWPPETKYAANHQQ